MRALLLYNPRAGQSADKRYALQLVAATLRQQSYEVEIQATDAKGSAGTQAQQAIAQGFDTIFACGGDGTIHDILQGMVNQPATLGIIPLGTANALARHIGLSLDAVEAVIQQLSFTPQLVPVGKIEMGEQIRYFTVMAGAGADGALVYRMLTGDKQTFGRAAYYLQAAKLFVTSRFPIFNLEYAPIGKPTVHRRAVSVMALRIDDLGGIFSPLARGAAIHDAHLQLVIVKPHAWLSLPLWFATGYSRLHRWNPMLENVNVSEFTVTQHLAPINLQADGEWIGKAPMRVTLLPNALRLLLPKA